MTWRPAVGEGCTLPDRGENVLVTVRRPSLKYVTVGYWTFTLSGAISWYTASRDASGDFTLISGGNEVTAWQPLPDPQ